MMQVSLVFCKMFSEKRTKNLIVIALFLKLCACNNSIQVEINQGSVSGLIEKTFFTHQDYYAFRGIPFAVPPIGARRFRPPVPLQHWEGTYKAHTTKPTCLQFSYRRRNDEPIGFSGSEDCLYLSVYTPSLKGTAAVIVFDYNDNFKTGFNGSNTYSPDFFMEENVIVVTINHRLDIFGYFTTEDDAIPPNAGLKDFILGLNWIQDNIGTFGGDPDRVTIMGNRGGAALANILLYTRAAKNLFSAVIIQDGSALEPIYFYDSSRSVAFKLGGLLNITTSDSSELLDKIQEVNAEVLMTEAGNVKDNNQIDDLQLSIEPFAPNVEEEGAGAVLTSSPLDDDVVNDVPILIGSNSRVGLDLTSHFIMEPKLLMDSEKFLFVFPIKVDYHFNPNSTAYRNALGEVKNFYLKGEHFNRKYILDYAVYIGDILLNYALRETASKLSHNLQSEVFYYVFDYRGLLNENSEYISKYLRFSMEHWGATVTDELCYLHLCSRIRRTYEEFKAMPSVQTEFKVLKKMVKLWTNFAKSRNPTPLTTGDDILKNIKWEPLEKGRENYLHIDKKFEMKENPLGERALFWDNFLAKYQRMALNGLVLSEESERDEL